MQAMNVTTGQPVPHAPSPAPSICCMHTGHYQFDAAAAVGDHLLAAVQVFSQKDPRRIYLAMDLNTGIVDGNDDLVSLF